MKHNLRKTKVKLATHMGHVMRMYLRHEGKNQHIKDLNISQIWQNILDLVIQFHVEENIYEYVYTYIYILK